VKSTSGARGLLVAGLAAASLISVASAHAGQYSVNYSNGAGCGIYTATGTLNDFNPSVCGGLPLGFGTRASSIPNGTRIGIQTSAPAGIAIIRAQVSPAVLININNQNQWGGGSYYSGGGSQWATGDISESNTGFSSSYWGFQLVCGHSPCTDGAVMSVNAITLTASENQGPALIAVGANNIWYQSAHWIWNAPGDPWSIALSGSDPSGVCQMWAIVNGVQINAPGVARDTTQWQQCPNWTWSATAAQAATVDTRDYVATSGPLALTLAAKNAAGVVSAPSETLSVDNDPVGVALSTPNDPNPSVWINHAVTVNAAASAGPSGVGGIDCALDAAAARAYPAGGVTINGDGTHTFSCTAWNNAIDPNGNYATGTSSESIKVDEAPPSIAFEPQNPGDPAQLTVDTGDMESGVAGGSIEIAPAGTSDWSSLPTSFDGQHLLAALDDAGLHGSYTIQATSCDTVGNCASTSETLTLPLRLSAASDVSFAKIDAPAQIVRKRVLVDFRYKRERRHGKLVKVKTGGHYRTVRLVIHTNARCAHKRIKTGRRRWKEISVCRTLKLHTVTTKRVAHGKPVTVHGLLLTRDGVPVANAPVSILTAPDNGLRQFSQAASVTTSTTGVWSVKLPAGPSRIIHAVYAGSATMLPATGKAIVNVPARIAMSITPRTLPWAGVITIYGKLRGGYVPPDGVALRLLVRYPGSKLPSPLLALRTNAKGGFTIHWTYNAGRGIATYPFSVATTATESDYPFAPTESRRIKVTFGPPTPRGCCRSGQFPK
jgi:hypothetical protein